MSIIRDLGLVVQSLEDKAVITASTAQVLIANSPGVLISTGFSTGNVLGATSTADTVITGTGRVIDRLSDLFTKNVPLVACPATHLYSSRGTTSLAPKLALGVKLQHGDSSGGGDMADYSTGSQPDDKVYFTSARTTAYAYWTTEGQRLPSNQSYYDLKAAKRYIRAVHTVDKCEITTESTGWEGARLSGTIAFLGGNTPKQDLKAYGSTSTST
jgi:hypothetical protein